MPKALFLEPVWLEWLILVQKLKFLPKKYDAFFVFSDSKPRFKWYFVTMIVLTYCDNNFLYCDFDILPGQEKCVEKQFCKFEAQGQGFEMFLRFTFPSRTIATFT